MIFQAGRAFPVFRRCFCLMSSRVAKAFLVRSVVILILSFTAEESLRFPPQEYSVRWYEALWEASEIQDAAWLSFQVAAITTMASVGLGVAGALAIDEQRPLRSTVRLEALHEQIRAAAPAQPGDHRLDGDIAALTGLVREGSLTGLTPGDGSGALSVGRG